MQIWGFTLTRVFMQSQCVHFVGSGHVLVTKRSSTYEMREQQEYKKLNGFKKRSKHLFKQIAKQNIKREEVLMNALV